MKYFICISDKCNNAGVCFLATQSSVWSFRRLQSLCTSSAFVVVQFGRFPNMDCSSLPGAAFDV